MNDRIRLYFFFLQLLYVILLCSRSGDYKSLPPSQPKAVGTYKPIPPPKPKNYRPPQQTAVQDENNGSNLYQHVKSYSMGASHMHNGVSNLNLINI